LIKPEPKDPLEFHELAADEVADNEGDLPAELELEEPLPEPELEPPPPEPSFPQPVAISLNES
jgi:hypothetical protein